VGHDCHVTESPDHPDKGLNDEQLRRVEEALDEAEEASRRLGRKDWSLLFVGVLFTLVASSLISVRPSALTIEIIASALAVLGVILAAIIVQRTRRSSLLADPDEPLRQRVKYVSDALASSARHLDLATRLIGNLQTELSARAVALESLRQEISDNEELARVTSQAAAAIDRLVESRNKEQERRMRRVGWRQGLVYAIFGAAVAVALVVFSHLLPTIK
jgi:hypothetical protein